MATRSDLPVFQKLQKWQDDEGMSDAALAAEAGLHQTMIWRAKRGLRALRTKHLLALQQITKIAPADWAEWFAQTQHLRGGSENTKRPLASRAGAGADV